MTRILTSALTFALVATTALTLSACSTWYWPDTYSYPTGYAHHDITPTATPHGYNKPLITEQREEIERAQNADAWRNAIGSLITPVVAGLDTQRPIAVVMDPGLTPLNSSAANYTRDMLVKMGYLVALSSEAGQSLVVKATPAAKDPDSVTLHLSALRGPAMAAQNSGVFAIPHQVMESSRLPGLTRYPATGPAAKPARDKTYNN